MCAAPACRITIELATQQLQLWQGEQLLSRYAISTALKGAGEAMGSGCTPRGYHTIRAKIGGNLPPNSVLVGRRPTGEIYSEVLAAQFPERDWILSRILWLCGTEVGRNRGGQVDSQRRYIYIHGTPDSEPMGVPRSQGCIRMHNSDLLPLFEQVAVGTKVEIREEGLC